MRSLSRLILWKLLDRGPNRLSPEVTAPVPAPCRILPSLKKAHNSVPKVQLEINMIPHYAEPYKAVEGKQDTILYNTQNLQVPVRLRESPVRPI